MLRPALEASAFQPLIRDFAFVVEADLPADKLLRAAQTVDRVLLNPTLKDPFMVLKLVSNLFGRSVRFNSWRQ